MANFIRDLSKSGVFDTKDASSDSIAVLPPQTLRQPLDTADNWNSGVSGNWTNGSDWSTGIAPTSGRIEFGTHRSESFHQIGDLSRQNSKPCFRVPALFAKPPP